MKMSKTILLLQYKVDYKVVYISDDHLITNKCDQIVNVSNNFLGSTNNRVHYLSFPYDNDDIDMINLFLKLQMPSPPPDVWPLYNCKVLNSYGKIVIDSNC